MRRSLDGPYLRVMDNHGPFGNGTSKAEHVTAENGEDYLIKGPHLLPEHRYVAANELIAAGIAEHLGLPILDYRVLRAGPHGDDLVFGSSWMNEGTYIPAVDQELFDRCGNRGRAYDMVVFDVWLINEDRTEENLMVRTRQGKVAHEGQRHLLLLNDHSHCLVPPRSNAMVLRDYVKAPVTSYVHLDFIRSAIVDPASLADAINAVERLSEVQIAAIVDSVPPELLPAEEKLIFRDFLLERRDNLRRLFQSAGRTLPDLQGTDL